MNPNAPVSKIMTTKLVTVYPEDPMHLIDQIFHENDFHHLPVVEKGQILAGIISREECYRVMHLLSLQNLSGTFVSNGLAEQLTAKDIMTHYPLCLDPEDSVGLAADIFLTNKFHALPIVDDGVLAGIITTHDLLKYSFQSPIEKRESIPN